ncbi:lytic murein transglycosylase B [Parashewanella curva]|uniref:Lytic murein transglycosylase B n=1 Tax=Parashewanella curva TaxID=2338552 RepID=A0A3L8Q031_9GAMM|nr:lytic murein transglycosylase B [Parashewanella curva]RLV60148.1 lytic murein transglycosylase B [Parashewanella curva]
MRFIRSIFPILALATSGCASSSVPPAPELKLKDDFIQQQADKGMDRAEVQQLLKQAKFNQEVIDAITRPWEAKPWYKYYPLFLTEKRLNAGLKFWKQHETTITKASKQFQVDPEVIVAIIGIETFYGNYLGRYSVLDSLYTLGFYYPPRGKFFRSELGNLMQLVKEENLDINQLKGSYAGAMGFGQFIPSSYRHYAVDFDKSGNRDLTGSPVDAIGSVANYLHKHRWQLGQPVALQLTSANNVAPKAKAWKGERLKLKVSDILSAQVFLKHNLDIDVSQPAMLIALDQPKAKEYWLGLNNFYVITRYNRSPLYAMAVYQFSQQLKQAHEKK